jgi:hypothetical protein
LKKIVISIFISCLILLSFSGCNKIMLSEYDHIKYNGIDYIHDEAEEWQPIGEKINEKLPVYLVDYTSQTNYKNIYYAQGFKDDDEHIFLFFNGLIYTKKDYTFPDIMNENVIVDKIKLTYDSSNSYIFEDKDFINLFMNEFRHKSMNTDDLKRIGKESYEISLYVKNSFAFVNGGNLAIGKKGQLGFENDKTMTVELLSQDLNNQIIGKFHH